MYRFTNGLNPFEAIHCVIYVHPNDEVTVFIREKNRFTSGSLIQLLLLNHSSAINTESAHTKTTILIIINIKLQSHIIEN